MSVFNWGGLASGAFGALLASTPATASDTAQAARISDAILAALVESSGVPGMGASIWQDGRIVWIGSAGLRDVDGGLPVTKDTRFRFASVSKLFAATAAARLREQGKLDVDAPISSLIPYLRQGWPTVTTAQLAAHTAGIPHYQSLDESRGTRHFNSVRDAVALVAGRPLLAAPGAAYSYSSWGYVLLSAVVEAQAGKPFLNIVAQDIAPGLAIGPDATGSAAQQASKAYEFVDHLAREAPAHDFSYTWAGGGLGGTAPALAAFGGRVLSGGLVSAATLQWIEKPARLTDGTAAGERDYTVGFGWRRSTDVQGRRILHHAGAAIGARSAVLLYPDQSMVVGLLSNASWTSAIELSARTLAAPFLPQQHGKSARACPVKVASHQVWENNEGAARKGGTARFAVVNGVCIGRIPVPASLAARFGGFPQRTALHLTIIGTDHAGGLSSAALVTPMGAYQLMPIGGGRYQARFDEKSSLTLRFG